LRQGRLRRPVGRAVRYHEALRRRKGGRKGCHRARRTDRRQRPLPKPFRAFWKRSRWIPAARLRLPTKRHHRPNHHEGSDCAQAKGDGRNAVMTGSPCATDRGGPEFHAPHRQCAPATSVSQACSASLMAFAVRTTAARIVSMRASLAPARNGTLSAARMAPSRASTGAAKAWMLGPVSPRS